jgi:branched-subunit amino acid aminotransferase/4-amino-4-deoxychorismate lyase
MATLIITLPDEHLQRLKEVANRLNITPEELARVGVEELLARPGENFQNALDYVLKKNEELYKRLA